LSAARISVRVTPRAGRNAIDGWDGDTLRVRVSAAPAGGNANDAVCRLLAKRLKIATSNVAVVSGTASRVKLIAVAGLPEADVRSRLGQESDPP